ncbi:MAG: prepilin peptidase [bacterium]|nr:prepilin peptidase [bacterium]
MWLLLGTVLAGAITGSFLTTVIERAPNGESFLNGRSRCTRCRKRLTPLDLVPIFSFLFLRGRCRHCKAPIPRWHLAVELATVVLFVSALLFGSERSLPDLAFVLPLLAILLALAVIDLQTFLLPDPLVVALAGLGLLRSVIVGAPGLGDSVLGGVAGLCLLGALALIPWRHSLPTTNYQRQTRSSAMGLGDAKLAGAMGIILGFPSLLTALFVAFVAGGLVAGLLVLGKRATLKSRVPFGPFLAGATGLVLLVPQLPEAFFRLLGL